MGNAMRLGDIRIEVVRKEIKHVHLGIYPPVGRVRIAAPRRLSDSAIRAFAIGKMGWIRRQRQKMADQERETPREFIENESHFIWGERKLLHLVEKNIPPSIEVHPRRMVLQARPGTSRSRRSEIVEEWYRSQVREASIPLIAKWEKVLGVQVRRLFVQKMRTRWGTCNHRAGRIRLNTELAKKPRICLEYLVVHEMAHLLEPSHNARFIALMDRHMPAWRSIRQTLNRLPVRHEDWKY